MSEIVETYEFLCNTICGKGLTYEQVKEELLYADGNDYSVEITYEDEDCFDVDVGIMTFTISKDEDDGFLIGNKATARITKQETDGSWTEYYDETIDIEL